ncbi:MAG: CoB--CoM heterodisulfide reductase iron-sulfur subunit A family protein [Candidatus Bipolaricaulota bacterium]|nr:MAG: CoB--CoM heterodisulfide reductase iron-sulfur subunit A family protein [Candidatus Bipolaricaulota bacterium]
MVIGGGIAGVQAALDLAAMSVEAILVESGPSIGGRMAQLDKTFPTNDCAMCILSPKLVAAGDHPLITIHTTSEVTAIDGEAPAFRVKVIERPRYVDVERCTACGRCSVECPVSIPDPYNEDLVKTKCIRVPFPQAVPSAAVIDPSRCLRLTRGTCGLCEQVCEPGAVNYGQTATEHEIDVGGVILATGYAVFDAVERSEYGYRAFPNVVTSLEFERLLSASGPTEGHIVRPSDGRPPRKIAFLQCVGSRDTHAGNDYCSSICCMQAAKDAIIVGEHLDDVESTVFHMDLRAYGKGFDRFIDRAESVGRTRFVRARVSSVEADARTDAVVLQYTSERGSVEHEVFDLAVLSVGLVVDPEGRRALNDLGLPVGEHGFVPVEPFEPVRTPRPGLFVCGVASGPKDIPESVVEASAAAAEAACAVRSSPPAQFSVEHPPERDIRGEPPRVGVFVCNCGINIGATIDVPSLVDYARSFPAVDHAEGFLFTCSRDAQSAITEAIREKELNRVVVAACTPRTHESLFMNTLRSSGLNPYLFEFVNIREQCSWVHREYPEEATAKAKDLLAMAIDKAALLQPLSTTRTRVEKSALVVGGGAAGMTAALTLAAQGFPVHLVEKEGELGGNLRHLRTMLDGGDPDVLLESLRERVRDEERITVHLGATVEDVVGYVGNFETRLAGVPNPIRHGVAILATGATAVEPTSHRFGTTDRVMTLRSFENRLAAGDVGIRRARSIVMVQCVESRVEDRPYCSRICCSAAVKNALRFKEVNPKASVYVLYRDMRTYGLRESWYREARRAGVLFTRYDVDCPPRVSVSAGGLRVEVDDAVLGRRLVLHPDAVVLASGIAANPDNKGLSQVFKVPLGPDGFFLEAHIKLRPVDFATDGVFVCGLAHYPKDLSEAIAQAKAAAGRAATVLANDTLETEAKIAEVRGSQCSGCGVCVEVCAYHAIELDEETGHAVVKEALCKGCGVCAATCHAAAIDLRGFANEQILAMLEAVGR